MTNPTPTTRIRLLQAYFGKQKDEIERLRKDIKKLRAALVEANEDRLYDAIGCGVTGNEAKWWPGGMSDAEWFCTMAEIGRRPQFTKEDLLSRVPAIAQKMVDAVCAHCALDD